MVRRDLASNGHIGDLHDGTGLTDSTSPDGEMALPIFDHIDFDLLTIGGKPASRSQLVVQILTLE